MGIDIRNSLEMTACRFSAVMKYICLIDKQEVYVFICAFWEAYSLIASNQKKLAVDQMINFKC